MSTLVVHSPARWSRVVRAAAFKHGPNDVADLPFQTGQGVQFGFPLADFFLKVDLGLRDTLVGNLCQRDVVDGLVQSSVAAPGFDVPFPFARLQFARGKPGVLGERRRRGKPLDVFDLGKYRGRQDRSAPRQRRQVLSGLAHEVREFFPDVAQFVAAWRELYLRTRQRVREVA